MKDNTLREVKKRLYSYPKLDKYISDYEEELKGIQEKIIAHRDVGASSMSLTGVRGSDLSDPTASKALKIDTLQDVYSRRAEYIAQKIDKYYKEKQSIESALEKVSQLYRNLIEERYFNCNAWCEVAKILDMSTRNCEKQGRLAVKELTEILKKEELS